MFVCIFWIILLVSLFQDTKEASTSQTNNTIQCGNLTCFHRATCLKDEDCKCKVGYIGKTCFDDLDECKLGDPCLHRGHCHNNIGSYRCSCLDGWSGENIHCGIKINLTSWKCTPGWIGDKCQDKCLNNSMCQQNEICKKYGRGFQCVCAPGWQGQNCTTDIDECTSNSCPKNATCTNTPGSYQCLCESGWKGANCNADIDECRNNPCQHSSTCTNAPGYYNCTCAKGWKGVTCSEDIDECNSKPCSTRETCKNTFGSFECRCYKGFQGISCDIDVDECKTSPCFNNGSCMNTFGSYKCRCSSGWQGCNCNIDINECTSSTCNNTSVCRNSPGSFTCIQKRSRSTDISSASRTYTIVGTALISILFGFSVAVFIGLIKLVCFRTNGNATNGANKTMLKKLHIRNQKKEQINQQTYQLQQQQNLQLHVHLHPQQKVIDKHQHEELEIESLEHQEYLHDHEQQGSDAYHDRSGLQHIPVYQPSQHEQLQQHEEHRQTYWLRKIKRYFKHIQNPLWRY